LNLPHGKRFTFQASDSNNQQEHGSPMMIGLVDFWGVYLDLDDDKFDWYLTDAKNMLEDEMMKVSVR
jgi:hypothetical protein